MKTLEQLQSMWDDHADEYNKWDALGDDEIVEFAQNVERERCAQVCKSEIVALKLSGLHQHAAGAQGCLNGIAGTNVSDNGEHSHG